VLLRAGARSVQSTPMISSSGHLVGIVSTHFGEPHGLRNPANLRLVDLFARQAADVVEHSRTCRLHPAV
jgi:GAF domain-containing protein